MRVDRRLCVRGEVCGGSVLHSTLSRVRGIVDRRDGSVVDRCKTEEPNGTSI